MEAEICFEITNQTGNGTFLGRYPHCKQTIVIDAKNLTWSGKNEQGNDVEFGWDSMDSEYQCKAAIFNCTRDCECIQHNLTCTKGDIITGTKTTSCRLTTGKFLNAHMCQKSLKKPASQEKLYQDINMSEDVYVEPRKALQVSEEEDKRSIVVLEENEEYLDLTVLQ
ncbi:hypothetical protein E2320_010242 [Naja naja]|nr:hypothetical protein E2320_010242 [Naja naja]